MVDPRNVAVFEEKQYGTNYEHSMEKYSFFHSMVVHIFFQISIQTYGNIFEKKI